MKNLAFLFTLLLLSVNLASAQTTEEVMELVQLTKTAIKDSVQQTFTSINGAKHPYKNKDNPSLYVFVFDTNLNVVAHAFKPQVVGKNVKGKPDVKGKKFRDEMLDVAQKDGKGWVDYYFSNPKTKKVTHKTAYFELANGSDGKNYIVGSGKYFEEK